MNDYSLHLISGDGVRLHRIRANYLSVENGVYLFHNGAPEYAHALFPVRHYYVKKES